MVHETEAAGRLLESLGHSVQLDFPKQIEDPALLGHFMVLWERDAVDTITALRPPVSHPRSPATSNRSPWRWPTTGAPSAPRHCSTIHTMEWSRSQPARGGMTTTCCSRRRSPNHQVPLGSFVDDDTPLLGFIRAAAFAPFSAPFNITGQPAISLPLGTSDDGLPIGVQLVAAYGGEDLLVRVASQIEQAAPWAHRLPPR